MSMHADFSVSCGHWRFVKCHVTKGTFYSVFSHSFIPLFTECRLRFSINYEWF